MYNIRKLLSQVSRVPKLLMIDGVVEDRREGSLLYRHCSYGGRNFRRDIKFTLGEFYSSEGVKIIQE